MSVEPVVRLEAVSVDYGSVRALSDVTLALGAGATGLVGRNGAGKSTLLKTLLGFLAPAAGAAEVMGVPASGDGRRLRRLVGSMPENDCFVPGLGGLEHLCLAGEISGLGRRESARRAHETLAFVDLGEARYRPAEQYSAGMKQRLKLALALVHDPPLLLLDEPTVGMDPPGRDRMLRLVGDSVDRLGKSVILSTHLLADIESVCPQVVMLEAGRLLFHGPTAELHGRGTVRYEVEVTDRRDAVVAALSGTADTVATADPQRPGRLIAQLPAGLTPRELFLVADRCGTTVRSLRSAGRSLADVYGGLIAAGDA